MDLNLTNEQLEFQRIVRSFFTEHWSMDLVRRSEGAGVGYPESLYRAMAALDWLRLGQSDEYGGAGGLLEIAILYAEMGRALVETPHLYSAFIAASVLANSREDRHRPLVESILCGDALVIPALLEPEQEYGPEGIQLDGTRNNDGYEVRGTKLLVPFANVATHFLVPFRSAPGATQGVTLALIPAPESTLELEPLPNISGAPLFALNFDLVVDLDSLVGSIDRGWSLLGPVLERAAVLRAAQISGAGERLLELAVDYANDRIQFGAPIGKYQAVQYLCTNIAIDSHLTSVFAFYAAGLADEGVPIRRPAAMAKAYASRAARRMAQCAHEVFAGIAFMIECDVQLYMRRLKHWELDLGEDVVNREWIAEELLA